MVSEARCSGILGESLCPQEEKEWEGIRRLLIVSIIIGIIEFLISLSLLPSIHGQSLAVKFVVFPFFSHHSVLTNKDQVVLKSLRRHHLQNLQRIKGFAVLVEEADCSLEHGLLSILWVQVEFEEPASGR